MIPPQNCQNMAEIRAEIDALDQQVISLLGQRFIYVKAATPFKDSSASVQAPDRLEAMIKQRRLWAATEGLSADVIEKMYRDLVGYFIETELQQWQSEQH